MKNIFALLSLVVIVACSSSTGVKSDDSECLCDQNFIKSSLTFLASDELEGRETGERGADVASLFIASEFKKYGITPYGDAGTYFQNIDFISERFLESSHMKVCGQDGKELFDLKIGDDFFTQAGPSGGNQQVYAKGQLVFAGFGITADEYNYDDYEDLDVKNKIVIILWGEPYSISDEFFNGEKPTKYYNPMQKVSDAVAKGAAGVLMLLGDEVLQYWPIMKGMSLQANMSVKSSETDTRETPFAGALISNESAQKIFAGEEMDFDNIQKLLAEKEIPRGFVLKKNIECSFNMEKSIVTSSNVVGVIEGNDPVLKNEYIAVGAHYDHVGVTNGEVYNGADDNASGTVGVLETARMLSHRRDNKRSIIFLLYTGEEKGLYGSAYFTENFSSIKNVKANINLDMIGRGSIDSIYVLGPDHFGNEFNELIQKLNEESTGFVLDYSLSSSNYYYQSDHAPFAKLGIPVVFFNDNMIEDLHRPTDDTEKINFAKICKTVELVTKLASEFANSDKELTGTK